MTHIEASPETIRGVAAALARARLFDDKIGNADEARIAAWSELVEKHRLSQRDLLDGVDSYYNDNRDGRTMQVADLIAHARMIRRERAEREPDPDRWGREALIDERIAAHVAEISGTEPKSVEGALKYKRPLSSPLAIRCPWCRASEGSRCIIPGTDQQLTDYHPSRYEALEVAAHA